MFLLGLRNEGDEFWEAEEAEVLGLGQTEMLPSHCSAEPAERLGEHVLLLFLLQIATILAFPLMEGSEEPAGGSRAGEKPVYSDKPELRSPDLPSLGWKMSVPNAVHPPAAPLDIQLLCFPAGNHPTFFISGWGLFGSGVERSQKNS